MARPKREHCRECGRHVDECGPLSKRGLCLDDSARRMVEHNDQLAAHSGPWFDKWRASVAASVGAPIPPTPPVGENR